MFLFFLDIFRSHFRTYKRLSDDMKCNVFKLNYLIFKFYNKYNGVQVFAEAVDKIF